MKGYFSRIARQSGLRIAGQQTAQAEGARPPLAPTAPLEREEVVMLPPSHDQNQTLSRRTPEEGSVIHGQGSMNTGSTGEVTSQGSTARLGALPAEDTAGSDPIVHGEGSTSGQSLPPGSTVTGQTARTAQEAGEAQVDYAGELHSEHLRKADEKEFFSTTAEIIAGRQVERSEAQSVVIREIQEWIASGSSSPLIAGSGDENAPFVEPSHRSTDTDIAAGVIRILDEKEPGHAAESRDARTASSVEESTFDLSIGSVTVVIEGEPASHVPPQQPARRSEHAAERKTYPRLRRSYL